MIRKIWGVIWHSFFKRGKLNSKKLLLYWKFFNKRDFIDGTTYFDEVFPYNLCDDWELGLRLCTLGMKSFFV